MVPSTMLPCISSPSYGQLICARFWPRRKVFGDPRGVTGDRAAFTLWVFSAITRSFVSAPRLLLLDEPTASLGLEQTNQLLDLIEELRDRGTGVLLISHNMGDIKAVAGPHHQKPGALARLDGP